jgi:vitamin B12 transporter
MDLTLRVGRKGPLEWRMALQMRRDTHRDQSDKGEPWVRNEADVFSLPVEGEWRASRKWTIVYGASFDLMKFDTEVAGANRDTSAVNGQVAALYGLNESVQVRFSVAHRTRFAALKELFSSTSGNPDLKPMKTNAYEAGLDATVSKNMFLTAAVFYNDVKDLIDRADKNSPYMNLDSAELKGIEVTARWEPYTRASIFMAYSYLDAQDTSGPKAVDLAYRSEHKVDLTAAIRLPREFHIVLNYSYISTQDTAAGAVIPELDSYQLVGLRVSKDLWKGLDLYVNLHNLLDELYYESEGYPMEGRMISGGLRWAF